MQTRQLARENTEYWENMAEAAVNELAGKVDELANQVSMSDRDGPMGLPLFEDSETLDPDRWLEQFVSKCNWKKLAWKRCMEALDCLLMGTAKHWFNSLDQDSKKDKDSFQEAFLKKFSSRTPTDRHIASLITQEPGQSVTKFHSIVVNKCRKVGISDEEMLSTFLRGLRSDIRTFVYSRDAATWDQALGSARLYESLKQCGGEVSSLGLPAAEVAAAQPTQGINTLLQNQQTQIDKISAQLETLVQQNKGGKSNATNPNFTTHCGYCGKINHETYQCRARARDLQRDYLRMQQPQLNVVQPQYVQNPMPQNIPFVQGPMQQNTLFCRYCKQNDHDISTCKIRPQRQNSMFCTFCKRNNHTIENCRIRLNQTGSGTGNAGSNQRNNQIRCLHCNRLGHKIGTCRQYKRDMGFSDEYNQSGSHNGSGSQSTNPFLN